MNILLHRTWTWVAAEIARETPQFWILKHNGRRSSLGLYRRRKRADDIVMNGTLEQAQLRIARANTAEDYYRQAVHSALDHFRIMSERQATAIRVALEGTDLVACDDIELFELGGAGGTVAHG